MGDIRYAWWPLLIWLHITSTLTILESSHPVPWTPLFYWMNEDIETHRGEISNSYLTARNTEKIVFNTRPECSPFGHAGHLLLLNTDLYSLKSFIARFHSHLSYELTILGFIPSMGGCDIRMRNKVDYYACVDCYLNDLIVVHKNSDHNFDYIGGKGFTIKETLPPE